MKTSMKRDLRRGAGVIAAVSSLAIYMVLVALPAGAAVACNFAAGVASVTLNAGSDAVTVSVNGTAIQTNSGGGAANCGVATTANTDTIDVAAVALADQENQSLTIDLSGGPFAPGLTDEAGATDEIEFTVNLGAGNDTVTVAGSAGADTIVVGAGGINLNAGRWR